MDRPDICSGGTLSARTLSRSSRRFSLSVTSRVMALFISLVWCTTCVMLQKVTSLKASVLFIPILCVATCNYSRHMYTPMYTCTHTHLHTHTHTRTQYLQEQSARCRYFWLCFLKKEKSTSQVRRKLKNSKMTLNRILKPLKGVKVN